MNLFDSSFLCLDIGRSAVRGIAHRVRSGRIDRSAVYSVDSYDTVFALKSVIDELERQIGTHFDSAYITGNFGKSEFQMSAQNTTWNGEHKISTSDVKNQISRIAPPENHYPMHIIPLRYDMPGTRNVATPVGGIDRQLISVFGAIFYPNDKLDEINALLRRAHIQADGFYDPHFLQNAAFRNPKQTTMFIDFGAEFSSVSIWTDRGPVCHARIPFGGTNITLEISEKLGIDFDDAMRIKRNVANMAPLEMDRFTPADTAYEFSRADINDIVVPAYVDIVAQLRAALGGAFNKYRPVKIIISGGGASIGGITEFLENTFSIPCENQFADASVRAMSDYIWDMESAHRAAYLARSARWHNRMEKIAKLLHRPHRRRRARFIPIMPSTLCFNMKSPSTYTMFTSGGISMIHVDIMDGFYVDRIAGGISELKHIRTQTRDHLHVHLMTESPTVWAADAIAAGADTIILSTNTSGLRTAVRNVRAAGRRVGVALNPESSVGLLKPILREIDEVMVMSVAPGAAGQKFDTGALAKISTLNAARKKYNLKLTISVDGGIDETTAQLCWAAGADLLVSGSYLARNNDFPLAVQSLLPQQKSDQ